MSAAPALLAPERRIALAVTPPPLREPLRAVLLLDARLGQIVGQVREPLLAQVRLAWWRDRLGESPAERPRGEPLLELIAPHWTDGAAPLTSLVDGWEELLGEAPLAERAIAAFAAGRGAAFAELGARAGDYGESARLAGERWAFADFAFRTSHPQERESALHLGLAAPPPGSLPRSLRGLAVLDGLAARAIERGTPLLGSRGAALTALRLGLFGR